MQRFSGGANAEYTALVNLKFKEANWIFPMKNKFSRTYKYAGRSMDQRLVIPSYPLYAWVKGKYILNAHKNS